MHVLLPSHHTPPYGNPRTHPLTNKGGSWEGRGRGHSEVALEVGGGMALRLGAPQAPS